MELPFMGDTLIVLVSQVSATPQVSIDRNATRPQSCGFVSFLFRIGAAHILHRRMGVFREAALPQLRNPPCVRAAHLLLYARPVADHV